MNQRWARLWLKPGRPGTALIAGCQGAQRQRAFWPVGEHDGAALGFEGGDRVVENGVQELVLALEVDQVMAGTQQRQQLLPLARTAFAVERQSLDRLVPAVDLGRLDEHVLHAGGRHIVLLDFLDSLDHDRQVAEADQVVHLEWQFARPEAGAVEVGAVGAAEVADAPAVAVDAEFGMPAADGSVVENHFEGGEPAGTQDAVRFPDLAFDLAGDAAQANSSLHVSSLVQVTGRAAPRSAAIENIACDFAQCTKSVIPLRPA